MQCRICGFEFYENQIPNHRCSGCRKRGCNVVHCPNCGFPNSPEFEQGFEIINKLKNKLKFRND